MYVCRDRYSGKTVPYSIACSAWKLRHLLVLIILLDKSDCLQYSRSLLSGESLVDDLGVAVDAQVVDGLGVLRRRVGAAANVLQRRSASGSSDGLHDGVFGCGKKGGRRKRERKD